MSSTPGEMCTVELQSMTDMSFPQTSSTPGEMCAVELESRTVLGFPQNDSTPGESCAVELDFPRVSFPPGESCAEDWDYIRPAWLTGLSVCTWTVTGSLLFGSPRTTYGFGRRPIVRNGTAGLPVPILGVRGTAVFRRESSVWFTTSSSTVPEVRRSTGVGLAPRLFANVLVDQLGKEQAMAAAINLQRDAGIMLSRLQILSQFATTLHRMLFQRMVLGIGQSLFPRAEVADLSPAPRAARAASYMSAMCLWRPQRIRVIPGQCRLRHAARV